MQTAMNPKPVFRSEPHPYIVAVALIVAAVALRLWPLQPLGVRLAWLTFYPAVIVAALYGGFSAGLLGAFLSCLAALFLLPVLVNPVIRDSADWLGMIVFFATCTMISGVAEAMHRARAQAKQANEQLETTNFKLEEEITERKQAEDTIRSLNAELERRVAERTAELQQSEERFRLLVEGVKDYAIYLLDTDGRVASWNAGAERLEGYSAAEIIGRRFSCFYTQGDVKQGKPDRALSIAAAEGRFEDEGWRVHKDGSTFWANVVVTALHDTTDKLVGFSKITRDVTERKQAEQALHESERKFFLLFEKAAFGAALAKLPDGLFLEVNEAFERMLGYSKQEAIGKTSLELGINPDVETRAQVVAELQQRGFVRDIELKLYTKSGEARIFSNNINMIEFGGQNYVLTTIQDITDRKRAEEEIRTLNAELERRVVERTSQLEAANKELEAFSYSVSHDLRAPLRHIDGFAGLLQKYVRGMLDVKGIRYLDTISASAKKMGTLIDELLVFSRMAKIDLKKTPVDVSKMVYDILKELDHETRERTITFDVQPLPIDQADPTMLRLVFQNLISNAMKYTRKQPSAKITVSCEERGDERAYRVQDNGVGFDMKYSDKLFGVFQRLHREEEFEGTGIGLANVRRIVHRHGGRVWAEGAVNTGATFYFSLPHST